MAIGIKVGDTSKAEIGSSLSKLIESLDNENIRYTIPFDKETNNNKRETILLIEEIGTEISVENNIIKYIKCQNNKYSNVDKIDNITSENVIEHLRSIKEAIKNRFSSNEYVLKVEKVDTKDISIVILLQSNIEKVRVIAVRDGNGNIYVNTLRLIS